jgi:glucosylceramidase
VSFQACTGYAPGQHKVLLGDWHRGVEYAHDILNNLRNWVVGWTDWNLCLDLQGGPNWVGNWVDAPILVFFCLLINYKLKQKKYIYVAGFRKPF